MVSEQVEPFRPVNCELVVLPCLKCTLWYVTCVCLKCDLMHFDGGPSWMPSTCRRITRSMARQSQVHLGTLMMKEELEDDDHAQVFHVFLIKELDL